MYHGLRNQTSVQPQIVIIYIKIFLIVPQSPDTQMFSKPWKFYTRYHGASETEHGLSACTVDNPRAKARGLSLRTGAQSVPHLSHVGLPGSCYN